MYVPTSASDSDELIKLVTDRLGAESSKTMYRRALRDFLAWHAAIPGASFNKATVQRLIDQDEPGFWESLGYHNHGDPWKEERYQGD